MSLGRRVPTSHPFTQCRVQMARRKAQGRRRVLRQQLRPPGPLKTFPPVWGEPGECAAASYNDVAAAADKGPGGGFDRATRPTLRRLALRSAQSSTEFELAINRTRRVFTAFATAAAIGGLVGSPAALADPEPPPPPPVPAPAPVDVREVPEVQCGDTGLPWTQCEDVLVPSPPPADTPRAPDAP